MIASVTYVNGSFTIDGEDGSESQVGWEEAPTLLGTHNTIGSAHLQEGHSTWMRQSQHTREDNTYNTQRMSPHDCNSSYSKYYVKGLSDVSGGNQHWKDQINNTYNIF